jgi:hypothetical protein
MNKKFIECEGCKEKIKIEDFEETSRYANILEGEICEQCEEADLERPSTLIKWNGEKEVIHWGEFMAWDDDGDEPERWFWDILGKNRREWKSTDAWRGYYETKLDGLVKLADGWVTGWPDETVAHKQKAGDLFELLNSEREPLPGELFWLFESTSNLFSTASEILVRESDKEVIVEWLEKHGYTLEDLEEAFG